MVENTENNTGDKFRSRPSPLGARDEEEVRFDSTFSSIASNPATTNAASPFVKAGEGERMTSNPVMGDW
jgi:hypothetical protein